MSQVSAIWWIALAAAVIVLLAIDLFISSRGDEVPSHRVSAAWVTFYAVAALAFGAVVWAGLGSHAAGQFLAGWLTEYSLSVDNVFVFLLLLDRFVVPGSLRLRVLTVGIVLALLIRAALISLGAAALSHFDWLFIVFGLFLIWTAITLARTTPEMDADDEPGTGKVAALLTRFLPATTTWHGERLLVKENGRRVVTPLLMVIVVVGVTDVLFALDSIPAILGLTQEPYLVVAANAFALMGLRQLSFLVSQLLSKVIYLSQGLAVILGFIGLKLIAAALPSIPDISTRSSLAVVLGTLAVTVIVSAMRRRHLSI